MIAGLPGSNQGQSWKEPSQGLLASPSIRPSQASKQGYFEHYLRKDPPTENASLKNLKLGCATPQKNVKIVSECVDVFRRPRRTMHRSLVWYIYCCFLPTSEIQYKATPCHFCPVGFRRRDIVFSASPAASTAARFQESIHRPQCCRNCLEGIIPAFSTP